MCTAQHTNIQHRWAHITRKALRNYRAVISECVNEMWANSYRHHLEMNVLECLHADVNVLCRVEYVAFYHCQNVTFFWALVHLIVYLSVTEVCPRGKMLKIPIKSMPVELLLYLKGSSELLCVEFQSNRCNVKSDLLHFESPPSVNGIHSVVFPLEENKDSGFSVNCSVFIGCLVRLALKMNRTLVLHSITCQYNISSYGHQKCYFKPSFGENLMLILNEPYSRVAGWSSNKL